RECHCRPPYEVRIGNPFPRSRERGGADVDGRHSSSILAQIHRTASGTASDLPDSHLPSQMLLANFNERLWLDIYWPNLVVGRDWVEGMSVVVICRLALQ